MCGRSYFIKTKLHTNVNKYSEEKWKKLCHKADHMLLLSHLSHSQMYKL